MKEIKTSSNKSSRKVMVSTPSFKKPKSLVKLKLPKGAEIDENIIKKIKFDKKQTKEEKKIHKQAPAPDKAKVEKVKEKKSINKKALGDPLTKIDKTKKIKTVENLIAKPITSFDRETRPRKSSSKLLPTTCVSDMLVTKAVNALHQLAQQQKKKNQMFEDEASVFTQIMCIKIQNNRGNISFKLPHSTAASTGEVCLVTPDLKKGRKPDHEPSVEHWEEVLRSAGVDKVKTVLPMRQLRVEYDQYELKRRLLTQHDFIMVDTRVLNHVSHILGKAFFKKHNMLIPVRLHNVKDIKKNIESALKTAILRLSEGPTSTILVGHMGMSPKEIKENILALVQQLPGKYPGGEQNIRSLSIKLPLSLAVPLYVTLRSKKTVMPPKLNIELPKQHQVVEGELSTIIGGNVKVTPEGGVILHKNNEENLSDMEEENDEEDVKTSHSKKNAKTSKKQSEKSSTDSSEDENGL